MIKIVKNTVMPWLVQENIVENRRFNAPDIKSLHGKPLVFSVEREQELYFQHLRDKWQ